MSKVGIALLKGRLSEYLHRVRRGEEIVVMDRRTPVARIVPYEPGPPTLVVRRPALGAPKLRDIPMPPALGREIDVLAFLDEERADRDLL